MNEMPQALEKEELLKLGVKKIPRIACVGPRRMTAGRRPEKRMDRWEDMREMRCRTKLSDGRIETGVPEA